LDADALGRAGLLMSVRLSQGTMRNFTLFLFLLLIAGCNTGIIVHDQNRAAELMVDFLSGFKSEEGRQLSYDWTDDAFKKGVSPAEFSRMVASIRKQNQGADIQLRGHEVFGPVETIIIYASSQVSAGKMYFRFLLVGTKTKDYYLLSLDISDTEFPKKGVYNEYEQVIIIQGV
jgi:hypothetical protein